MTAAIIASTGLPIAESPDARETQKDISRDCQTAKPGLSNNRLDRGFARSNLSR
jgi:hypothetical protein